MRQCVKSCWCLPYAGALVCSDVKYKLCPPDIQAPPRPPPRRAQLPAATFTPSRVNRWSPQGEPPPIWEDLEFLFEGKEFSSLASVLFSHLVPFSPFSPEHISESSHLGLCSSLDPEKTLDVQF